MFIRFTPFEVTIKKETLKSRTDLENFNDEDKYPVLAVDIERQIINDEIVTEKKSKGPPGIVQFEIEDEDDDEKYSTQEVNLQKTVEWILVGNKKSGEYRWLLLIETNFACTCADTETKSNALNIQLSGKEEKSIRETDTKTPPK
jgi:hypothetical protein